MRTLKAKELDEKEFMPYGSFANLMDRSNEKLGAPPIEFYRDIIQQSLGPAGVASFSICRVEKRDPVIDTTEYHTAATEGLLPIDSDVLIHVAPASPGGSGVPVDKIAVYRVPQGTMVILRPGVWHHAPFTVSDAPSHVLVVLPERTYANDCQVFHMEGDDRIRIA